MQESLSGQDEEQDADGWWWHLHSLSAYLANSVCLVLVFMVHKRRFQNFLARCPGIGQSLEQGRANGAQYISIS